MEIRENCYAGITKLYYVIYVFCQNGNDETDLWDNNRFMHMYNYTLFSDVIGLAATASVQVEQNSSNSVENYMLINNRKSIKDNTYKL